MSRVYTKDFVTWGLTPDAIDRACDAAALKGGPLPAHMDDFVLAAACAARQESAWEHFAREFHPVIRRAAAAIDPAGRAMDLADELLTDLYTQQLFRYFHGRSSLRTWLRAVLAQRWIDRIRAGRRTEALGDDADVPAVAEVPHEELTQCRATIQVALMEGIQALGPRDRLVLGCYYSQGMKLAAIGRLLREHEATISRHLTRIRAGLRVTIETALQSRAGFDAAACQACLRSVMNDAGDIDLTAMIARSGGGIVHTERDDRAR